MGISGLLPALRSIQTTKKLQEFAGQTIAVDGYVWLHKGVFSCATELATGKRTNKYVDYVMHRVRLLRHFGIEPYLVFDGGPLPAKRGTEENRKQKRDENLAMGNTFTREGKAAQARECYVKCVDVSPQMAYQVIKALKAESVPYVVAPYEADAQLAFLESKGIVQAILTEDSDLLVFGCKQVLFKLDTVANTVVSISRSDFSSISSPLSEISLVGWGDKQFRNMAILSGCDYIPSIPGIGLKTANAMLRRWKTAEQVVKVILLEGKKSVPRGYIAKFRQAEKCFLYQRVYSPSDERLVHLTEVNEDGWTEEDDAYVGRDIDPSSAKLIASGELDPETMEPIEDINPNYVPKSRKALASMHTSPYANRSSSTPSAVAKGKGKEKEKPPKTGGLFDFFGPNAIIPQSHKTKSKENLASSQPLRTPISPVKQAKVTAGKASGKRTLVEVMDEDIERKKRAKTYTHKRKSSSSSPSKKSKFFDAYSFTPGRRDVEEQVPASKSDGYFSEPDMDNHENVFVVESSDLEEDGDAGSMLVHGRVDEEMFTRVEKDEDVDVVEQEEGYISPYPFSDEEDAEHYDEPQDLSSPVKHGAVDNDDFDGLDALSSPIETRGGSLDRRKQVNGRASPTPGAFSSSTIRPAMLTDHNRPMSEEIVLVNSTPSPVRPSASYPSPFDPSAEIDTATRGAPDLADVFGDEDDLKSVASESEIGGYDTDMEMQSSMAGDADGEGASLTPPTPFEEGEELVFVDEVEGLNRDFDLEEDSDDGERARKMAVEAVAKGWRAAYAAKVSPTSFATAIRTVNSKEEGEAQTGRILKRRETNITPIGRFKARPASATTLGPSRQSHEDSFQEKIFQFRHS